MNNFNENLTDLQVNLQVEVKRRVGRPVGVLRMNPISNGTRMLPMFTGGLQQQQRRRRRRRRSCVLRSRGAAA